MATIQTRIGPADHGRRMTLDEFREAEEQPGYRYELARGVLHVVEVPGRRHWRVVDNLHEALSDHRRRVPQSIDLIGHGSDVRFRSPTLDSDRHPDLGVALVGDPVDEFQRPRPSLVIEVVSPGNSARGRDYAEKAEDYLAIGVREYWIVDPELRQVTVLLRVDGPAWEEAVALGDRPIPSSVLPGFFGTVAQLWEGID
jgi:Uma2 family endonuclease